MWRARHVKLGMIWCIIRGRTVAYRLRIENGGIVIGNGLKGMVVECEIINSPGAAVTVRGDGSMPGPMFSQCSWESFR